MNSSNNNSNNLLEPPSGQDRMPTRSRNKSPNSAIKNLSSNPKKRKLDEMKNEGKIINEELVVN